MTDDIISKLILCQLFYLPEYLFVDELNTFSVIPFKYTLDDSATFQVAGERAYAFFNSR